MIEPSNEVVDCGRQEHQVLTFTSVYPPRVLFYFPLHDFILMHNLPISMIPFFFPVSFSQLEKSHFRGKKKTYLPAYRSVLKKTVSEVLSTTFVLYRRPRAQFFLFVPPGIQNSCYKNVIKTSELHFFFSRNGKTKSSLLS